MSLFSTIAYDSVPQARGFSLKGIGMMVAGLVLGAAIGLAIANSPTTVGAPAAPDTGMALDDFIRLNTTSYDGLVPVGSAVVTAPQGVGDAFLDMNIASYEGLVPAATAAAITPQSVVDPSFLYWNTTAFDNLTPTESLEVVQSGTTVDPDFWYWNTTSLEYPAGRYADQPSGPR